MPVGQHDPASPGSRRQTAKPKPEYVPVSDAVVEGCGQFQCRPQSSACPVDARWLHLLDQAVPPRLQIADGEYSPTGLPASELVRCFSTRVALLCCPPLLLRSRLYAAIASATVIGLLSDASVVPRANC